MSIIRYSKNKFKKAIHFFYSIGKSYDEEVCLKGLKKELKVDKNNAFYVKHPFYIFGTKYITVGNNFISQPGLRIECIDSYNNVKYNPSLVIGNNVIFNFYCHVGCINHIEIGNNVLIGSHVLITDHSHGTLEKSKIPYYKRELYSKNEVIIKDNVWIGENACIMPGVTIGEGSIVGANAVVTHNVPPYSVVAGVPAKVIKHIE